MTNRLYAIVRLLCAFLGFTALILLASPASAQSVLLRGTVQTGQTGIAASTVTLYQATRNKNNTPITLATAQTDSSGHFQINYTPPARAKKVLYLIAQGGMPVTPPSPGTTHIRLAAMLGAAPQPDRVVINERTTVATAFAMAQFIVRNKIGGKSPGLQNAAATSFNLVDVTTGNVAPMLANPPNGLETSTMRAFNSLANILAECVNITAQCDTLMQLATPPGGDVPRNTLQAAVNIAHNPANNAPTLYTYSTQNSEPYLPALNAAPDAWTLAIKYVGNGHEFDGPGNMVFDRKGNIWSNNNYLFNSDHTLPACGDTHIMKLTPTGQDAPGAPYEGGGVNGAGFGITLDPSGDLWVSNFGFAGLGCTSPPPSNSVSKFSSAGVPQSPPTGFLRGEIDRPQGIVSDPHGNIWIANCGRNTITQYRGGDPENNHIIKDVGLDKPFAIALDAFGNAWVTNNGNHSVVALVPDGTPLFPSPITDGGIQSPLGIAIDSLGNVWVSNSGGLSVPCGPAFPPSESGGSVTLLRSTGRPSNRSPFTGGGLTLPWGIAVDGNDNIWVANFGGQRLSHLCGARSENCPPGHRTGDPISPDTGYTSDALDRNTGIAIDPSGNVWLANNWLNVPIQTNPGGDGLVVYIGIAAPVKTPMFGPPRQP